MAHNSSDPVLAWKANLMICLKSLILIENPWPWNICQDLQGLSCCLGYSSFSTCVHLSTLRPLGCVMLLQCFGKWCWKLIKMNYSSLDTLPPKWHYEQHCCMAMCRTLLTWQMGFNNLHKNVKLLTAGAEMRSAPNTAQVTTGPCSLQ